MTNSRDRIKKNQLLQLMNNTSLGFHNLYSCFSITKKKVVLKLGILMLLAT